MPTKIGNIWAQWTGWHYVLRTSHTLSVFPQNRDITTNSAISLFSASGRSSRAETGVWRIVSNGVLEEFEMHLPRIQRENVTEIVFRTWSDSRAHARHVINFWN